jgi:hypothetical protein
MSNRPITDRLLDRIWTHSCRWMQDESVPGFATLPEGSGSSVSGTMGWPVACEALASGTWDSCGFRRRKPVREVVETLAPSDGRHFANWIAMRHPQWLNDKRFLALNDWGDPIQVPGFLLGTPISFSPTSLRYLAHALWLSGQGLVMPGQTVVEIGVGFGGLAAMNRLLGGAPTHMVDLAPVIQAAKRMLSETGNADAIASEPSNGQPYSVVSCYAFSELNRSLQDEYFARYIANSRRGMIVSNATMFSDSIGGRSDGDLVDWFRSESIPVLATTSSDLLSPADFSCKVTLLHWNRD